MKKSTSKPRTKKKRRFAKHPHTVDLHGKNRDNVFDAVGDHLHEVPESSLIITGKGNGSPNQEPVLRPMVETYLNRNGYWFDRAPPKLGGNGALLIHHDEPPS